MGAYHSFRRLDKQSYIVIVFGLLIIIKSMRESWIVILQNHKSKVDQVDTLRITGLYLSYFSFHFFFNIIFFYTFFCTFIVRWAWPRQPIKDGGES